MVSCGITKRIPVKLLRLILRATNARKPLKPACTIHIVVPSLFSFRPSLSAWARAYSLASFGLRLGIERLANVYDLMRWVFTSLNILSKLLSFLLWSWRLLALAFGFPFQVYLTRIKPFFVL